MRRYQVLRPIDDQHSVKLDLEFDSASAAETFRDAMRAVWQSLSAALALVGAPQARIVDVVERTEY